MRVQEIGKLLNANGYKKLTTKRINFETVRVGDYELSEFKHKETLALLFLVDEEKQMEVIDLLKSNRLNVDSFQGYIRILK